MEKCILCLEILNENDKIKINKGRGSRGEGWNMIKTYLVELEEVKKEKFHKKILNFSFIQYLINFRKFHRTQNPVNFTPASTVGHP